MKKLLGIIALVAAALVACTGDDETTWDKYTDYREANNAWLVEMQGLKNSDGTPYYNIVVPDWNPGSFILMHYFNDRAETEGNLTPLYTSTVDVRYYLHLYDGEPADSSTNLTTNGPGIYRAQVNSLIQGWAVALSEMRCGDTVEIIVPYGLAYGAQSVGSILPYSNLRFNMRLVDIPYYEASPYE